MSVNYPVDITLTSPAAESFRLGATVTIGSDWSLNSGWDLTANNDAVTIAGTGTFAIGAHAGGDVCVFVCEEYSFVPSFDLPGGALDDDGIVVNELSGEIFSIDIPTGSYDIHDSFADFAGISGSFGFPDTSPEGTLDDDGKTISAEDTSHYLDLAIDIDEWALYFASKVKKLKGLKNVNLEGDFSEVDTASQGGATVEFEIADLKYNLDEYQTKTFEFTATPQITLALPESLAWVVKTTNGSQVDSGTSSSVTFDAGNQIELTMPNDLSGNMSITPTFTLSNENESATLTGSFLDPGSLDAHTVVITWGLGEGSTTLSLVTGERSFSASHQYLDDAPAGTDADIYPITVQVSDDDTGSGDGGTSVLVSNVDPSGIVLKSPVIDENGTATVTGDFEDPGSLDIHSVLIVWGPNEGTTTLNLAPGARSFAASHQYLDDNPSETDFDVYPITATVSDNDIGSGIGRSGVTVNNIAPSSVVINAPVIDENGTATISGSFVDSGTEDTHTVVIAWGPGEGFSTLIQVLGDNTFTASHTYLDDDPTATPPDVYAISVWVEDDYYGVGTAASTVTVNNVAPSVVDLSSPIIDENGTATITGSIVDPGTLDIHTVVID